MKTKKFYYLLLTMLFLPMVSACQVSSDPEAKPMPQTEKLDLEKISQKARIVEKNKDYVVYQYSDVRIDQVSVLAAMYCKDNHNNRAYLDKVNLYKNNARRATFYCYK